MYPEVRAQMARKNIPIKTLADDPRINCTVSTMSLKLSGKAPLLFAEAIAIKDLIRSDLPLEKLFKRADEEVA